MKLCSLHILLVSMYSKVVFWLSDTYGVVLDTDHHDPDYHLESHSMQVINKTTYLYVFNCIA